MKKKHRRIVVDGVEYAWTLNEDDGSNFVTIWKDKKPIYENYEFEGDVTPKMISNLIKENEL